MDSNLPSKGMNCTDDPGAIVDGELASPETIGFLAVSRGTFEIGNIAADSQHMGPTTPTEYWTCDPSTSFDVPPGLAFAGALTRNNQSGVLAELCGNMWPPVSEHPHNVSVHSTRPDGVVDPPVPEDEEYSLVSFAGDLLHTESLPRIALEVDGDGGDDGHTITVDEATPGQEASFRITSSKPWLAEIYVGLQVTGDDADVVFLDESDTVLNLSEPVVLGPGTTEMTIRVQAADDDQIEGDESLTISIISSTKRTAAPRRRSSKRPDHGQNPRRRCCRTTVDRLLRRPNGCRWRRQRLRRHPCDDLSCP
jgi:hypothetical protein